MYSAAYGVLGWWEDMSMPYRTTEARSVGFTWVEDTCCLCGQPLRPTEILCCTCDVALVNPTTGMIWKKEKVRSVMTVVAGTKGGQQCARNTRHIWRAKLFKVWGAFFSRAAGLALSVYEESIFVPSVRTSGGCLCVFVCVGDVLVVAYTSLLYLVKLWCSNWRTTQSDQSFQRIQTRARASTLHREMHSL